MRICCLQHNPYVGPDNVARWARRRGHAWAERHVYAGQSLPELGEFDLLVVGGGTMGAYEEDRYPFLRDEKQLVRDALAAGRRVLGLCLGAQLMADALGGRAYRHRHLEVGWVPLRLTAAGRASGVFGVLPERFVGFSWHGDTFDLPDGGVSTVASEVTPNHGFEFEGLGFAVQFHLESSAAGIATLIRHAGHQVGAGPHVQPLFELARRPAQADRNRRMLEAFLERLTERT